MSSKDNRMFVSDDIKELEGEIEKRKEGILKSVFLYYRSIPYCGFLERELTCHLTNTGYTWPLRPIITHFPKRNNTNLWTGVRN